MELDDELCLCFHVTKRKVINFIRVEKPSRPGQLSECFGAGTGCGWCRAYLRRLFDEQRGQAAALAAAEPTAEEYAQGGSPLRSLRRGHAAAGSHADRAKRRRATRRRAAGEARVRPGLWATRPLCAA